MKFTKTGKIHVHQNDINDWMKCETDWVLFALSHLLWVARDSNAKKKYSFFTFSPAVASSCTRFHEKMSEFASLLNFAWHLLASSSSSSCRQSPMNDEPNFPHSAIDNLIEHVRISCLTRK